VIAGAAAVPSQAKMRVHRRERRETMLEADEPSAALVKHRRGRRTRRFTAASVGDGCSSGEPLNVLVKH
jgi:hypothetical protein